MMSATEDDGRPKCWKRFRPIDWFTLGLLAGVQVAIAALELCLRRQW